MSHVIGPVSTCEDEGQCGNTIVHASVLARVQCVDSFVHHNVCVVPPTPTCGSRLVDTLTSCQVAQREFANRAHAVASVGTDHVYDEQAVRPGRMRIDLQRKQMVC